MTQSFPDSGPAPRPITRRGFAFGLLLVLGFALIYGLVVRAYQVEGGLSVTASETIATSDITATVEPIDFDARTNTMTVRFRFDVTRSDLLQDGVRLAQGIRITIYSADGSDEVLFPRGEPIGNTEIEMGTSGELYAYPLDTHDGFIAVAAETYDRGAGGINTTTGELPMALAIDGSISGWEMKADLRVLNGYPLAVFDIKRAFSTQAFAIVLVAMAITVAGLAFITAVLTATNRRRFETPLLAWVGAILFALPLLRTYLPGSPPIGAALDIYLYLWTFVISVSALVLLFISWTRQRKAELLAELSEETAAHNPLKGFSDDA
jgi:hypothetical protein